MNKISGMVLVGIFLHITISNAQMPASSTWQTSIIEPYSVTVAFSKTTNIIFPYAIISVDIGSRDVLAQKAKGVENILQVKAAKESFPQTNISIITADGKLTSFLVDYAEQPSVLNLSLINQDKGNSIPIPSQSINQEQMQHYAERAANANKKIRGMKDERYGICFKLNGLFVHDDIFLLRFNILNNTNISYDLDHLRFYIRDQKKTKRTATQEIELFPLLIHNNTKKVKGRGKNTIVFVLPKFTIPDKKILTVQMLEKNGGRHLDLHVKNKKIIKAVPLK